MQALGDLFEIKAVCNRSREKAEAYVRAAGLGADVFVTEDWREVVAHADVDALIAALPVEHNLEIARAAAEAGKHILLEKPTAHNLEDAAAMVELAHQQLEDKGIVIMIAENYPYKLPLQAMARLVMGSLLPVLLVPAR